MTTKIEFEDTTEIETLEQNLYSEFQEMLKELTTDVSNHVINEVVTTRLNNIYQSFDMQIPKLDKSNDELRDNIEKIRNTQSQLYENIDEIISDVSTNVIKENVLTKLEYLFQLQKEQLPLIKNNNKELKLLNKDLSETIKLVQSEHEVLHRQLEAIIRDVTLKIIENVVFSELGKIYLKYQEQLPAINDSTRVLKEMTNEVKASQKHLYKDIVTVTTDVSERVIKNTVLKEFKEMYDSHYEQIKSVVMVNEEIRKFKGELPVIDKLLENGITSIITNMTETLSKEFKLRFARLYSDMEGFSAQIENQNQSIETLLNEVVSLKENTISSLNKSENTIEQLLQTNINLKEKIDEIEQKQDRKARNYKYLISILIASTFAFGYFLFRG